jgi:hypothetical protein
VTNHRTDANVLVVYGTVNVPANHNVKLENFGIAVSFLSSSGGNLTVGSSSTLVADATGFNWDGFSFAGSFWQDDALASTVISGTLDTTNVSGVKHDVKVTAGSFFLDGSVTCATLLFIGASDLYVGETSTTSKKYDLGIVNGNLTMQVSGTETPGMHFRVDAPGVTDDSLTVHGTATLAGTLNIVTDGTEAHGNTYILIVADNPITTDFASVNDSWGYINQVDPLNNKHYELIS